MKQPKMKACKANQLQKASPQLLFDKLPWSQLTDRQKAQLLLGTTRIPDAELFLQEFKSLEQPEVDSEVPTTIL